MLSADNKYVNSHNSQQNQSPTTRRNSTARTSIIDFHWLKQAFPELCLVYTAVPCTSITAHQEQQQEHSTQDSPPPAPSCQTTQPHKHGSCGKGAGRGECVCVCVCVCVCTKCAARELNVCVKRTPPDALPVIASAICIHSHMNASPELIMPYTSQVGSLNCDLVLPVNRVPQPGETLAANGMDTIPGGKVGIAAVCS